MYPGIVSYYIQVLAQSNPGCDLGGIISIILPPCYDDFDANEWTGDSSKYWVSQCAF